MGDTNNFAFGGFGGTGVAFSSGPQGLNLGNGVFRFMVSTDFRPGEVEVIFNANSWDENPARGPPAGTTGFNRGFTQRFNVVGATADLVRTIPAAGATPESVVALGGSTVGSTTINAAGYLEVVFRSSNGFLVDHTTIDGDELELRDAAGTLLTLGSPLRVGTSDTYRFSFTGSLVAGKYEVTFLAGSFSDTGGSTNQAELERFTVQTPSGRSPGPSTARSSTARRSRTGRPATSRSTSSTRPPPARRSTSRRSARTT